MNSWILWGWAHDCWNESLLLLLADTLQAFILSYHHVILATFMWDTYVSIFRSFQLNNSTIKIFNDENDEFLKWKANIEKNSINDKTTQKSILSSDSKWKLSRPYELYLKYEKFTRFLRRDCRRDRKMLCKALGSEDCDTNEKLFNWKISIALMSLIWVDSFWFLSQRGEFFPWIKKFLFNWETPDYHGSLPS